ncbi:methyltransferase domain-containing protein [Paenibacillus sp. p3-SID1389]|uniref:methyltransferase domain-containing protein n=1 Tax=Paenibacillus sp. p3-SID1389 TaxID=2916364 RepID=UPI0021A7B15A|nr:methyltransferase domain-containing protein [Paenibacillus sp. p3-SID1389]MCT2195579.1 methyltransferase domain-containing protein [Paenibacillus sp. p3-SID1389]
MSNNKVILSHPKVYFFCFSYKKEKDIEAIKKEVKAYYQAFKSINQEQTFKFISLEEELDDNEEVYDELNDVYYWGKNFSDLLLKEKPDIIHIFADSLEGYYLFERNYMSSSFVTLYTMTGMKGFQNPNEGYLVHLRHAIDIGNLYLFVESTHTKCELEKLGLQSHLMLPKVKSISSSAKMNRKDSRFTIGFASSPLTKEIWEDRGVYLLLSVAEQLKNYRFKLAWRYEGYEELIELIQQNSIENIEVYNGHLDMAQFYSDIDVMIAPYTSKENNHACPLSIVESVVLGIPVLVTEHVGLKNIIKNYQFGVVSLSDCSDMISSLNLLVKDYDSYKRNVQELGKELFDISYLQYDNSYLKIYDELSYQLPSPTLKQWQHELNEAGKFLVMGHEGMTQYYNDSFIAANYDESRFAEFPMRTYDRLERKAIQMLIDVFAPRTIGNNILDIASGDGRILRTLSGLGEITAVENSSFMIATSVNKLSTAVSYVKKDFFDFNTEKKFDIITVFRFIRHFDFIDRKVIFKKIYDLLADDGIIIADFPNTQAETQLRSSLQWSDFNVYDVFWHQFELIDELHDHGFEVLDQIEVGEFLNPGRVSDHLPLSRIVCFRKRRAV